MKRLCFGTLMNILYQARNQKVTNTSLCEAIFSAYRESAEDYDGSLPGHLKIGSDNVPPDIINAVRNTSAEDAANNFRKKVIPTIHTDKQKFVVLAIKNVLREDTSIQDDSLIGYEKGYEKYNILDNSTFNLGDLLASVFYYAILNTINKSCKKEIKEISKTYVDEFSTSTEKIYFSSEEIDKSIPLLRTLNDENFDNVFEKIHSLKVVGLSNPSTVQIYGLDIANCKIRFNRLKDYLIDNISNYVWSREESSRLKKSKSAGVVGARAIIKFIQAYKQSSETVLGEILLYIFLEQELGAPKIMTKIELGSGFQASKSDGVHLLAMNNNGESFRQLVFGASNIKGDLKSAVDNALHKVADIEKNQSSELQMVSDTIYKNIFDKYTNQYIEALFLPSKTKTPIPDMAFGIFLGYTISISKAGLDNSAYRVAIKEKMKQDVIEIQSYIREKIINENMAGYSFYIYVIPFNDADEERSEVVEDMLCGGIG